jgi:hypothetical protein
MKLSKKKESELYDIVYNEIMKARIQLINVTNNPNAHMQNVYEQVDELMSKLCYECPEQAINLFKDENKQRK